jgi:hypothetical protein
MFLDDEGTIVGYIVNMEIDIFYDNGVLNKNKLRETWLINNYYDLWTKITKFSELNQIFGIKFSNLIYLYHNDINKIPICQWCSSNNRRFIGFQQGYDPFCSKSCAAAKSRPMAEIKKRERCLEKWGVEHTSKLDSVKEKQKNTNLSKWGFVSPTNNTTIKEKQIKTMIDKWGVPYSGMSNQLLSKSIKTRRDKYELEIKQRFNNLNLEVIEEGLFSIKCDKCHNNYEIRYSLLNLRYFRYGVEPCLICNPLQSYGKSSENEIITLLEKMGIEYIRGNRTILNGRELDIYIPEYSVAIEFNGLWWHCDLHKDKNYHLDKKVMCDNLGINLVHIWEDDWLVNKEIVIGRLKSLFNLFDRKIFARKCKIVEIDSKTAFNFLEMNHLGGGINSSVRYGLVYNNELVSVITFGKLRRGLGQKNNNGHWELYRFCSLSGIQVIGAFSKMIKHFDNSFKPKEIVTYANRDWSVKNSVYEKNGFNFIGYTPVNYWYFNSNLKRIHRFAFRKDVLVKNGADPNKTEIEIMRDLGWNRIWDCGNLKYSKKY